MMPPGVGASSAAAALLRTLWAAPTPATLQGADHRLLDANQAYANLVGLPRQALVGRDPIDQQPADDRAFSHQQRELGLRNTTRRIRCSAGWSMPKDASAGSMSP